MPRKVLAATLICAALAAMVFYYCLADSPTATAEVSTGPKDNMGGNSFVPHIIEPREEDEEGIVEADLASPLNKPALDAEELDYPDHIFFRPDEHESSKQYDERKRREKKQRLDEMLRSILGHISENPINDISKLDSERLTEMLLWGHNGSNFTETSEIGNLLGRLYEVDDLLTSFEQIEIDNSVKSEVIAGLILKTVLRKKNELRQSREFVLRVLALIEAYLEFSKENLVSSGTSASIWMAFGELCPVDGGLDLIRRWTVEEPHGNEAIETSLVEYLGKWPLKQAIPLILEILETRRAGAIKGIVSAWDNSKSGLGAWPVSEAKEFLEMPLTEAVKTTKKSTAVLYAAIFASKELLKPRALEIADALLARRDNAYVSSQGFSFLKVHSSDTANATWLAWLESNSEYQMLAACMSAGNFREVSSKLNSINKLFELASKSHNKSDLQGAAGSALCQVDSNYSRTLDILHLWLNAQQIAYPTLVAAGRMVVWGPKDEVKEFLLEEINDANKQPQDRHYPMFLLAVLEPDTALNICFDENNYLGKLTEQTKLLVAAAAEGMDRNMYWQSGVMLRESCTETEPDWMKRIRLRQSSGNEHAEESVVGYAASRPK